MGVVSPRATCLRTGYFSQLHFPAAKSILWDTVPSQPVTREAAALQAGVGARFSSPQQRTFLETTLMQMAHAPLHLLHLQSSRGKKKKLIQPTETRGKGPQSEGEKSNSKDGSATWEGITLRRGIRRPWETGLTGGLLEAPAEGPAQPRTSPRPQPPRPAPPRAAMSRRVHCFTLYSSQQKMGYSGLNQIFRHCLSMLLQV